MTVTNDSFREDFPEFSDKIVYPESQVTYYRTFGDKMLVNPLRWGNVRDNGLELFMAHHLSLEAGAQASAKRGAPPGVQTGAVSGKTVGPVGVTYDTSAGLEIDAGHWNLTIYGTRFINLAKMIGAGGLQV